VIVIYRVDSSIYPGLKLEVDFDELSYRFMFPQTDGTFKYGMLRTSKRLELKDNALYVEQILWSGDIHKSHIKLIDASPMSIMDGF
jgi:hypothetical protein